LKQDRALKGAAAVLGYLTLCRSEKGVSVQHERKRSVSTGDTTLQHLLTYLTYLPVAHHVLQILKHMVQKSLTGFLLWEGILTAVDFVVT